MQHSRTKLVPAFCLLLLAVAPRPAAAGLRLFEDAASRAMARATGFLAVRLDPALAKSFVAGFPSGGEYLAGWIEAERRRFQEVLGLDPLASGSLIYSFDLEDRGHRLLDARLPYQVDEVAKRLAAAPGGRVTLLGREWTVGGGSTPRLIGPREEIRFVEDGVVLLGPAAALDQHLEGGEPDAARKKLVERLESWTDGTWMMAHVPVSEAVAARAAERMSRRGTTPLVPVGLVQRVRSIDATWSGTEAGGAIGFEEAGAAQAAVSVVQGLRDTLLGQIESGSVTLGRILEWLSPPDPARPAPAPALEKVRAWFGKIAIGADGATLEVNLPKP